jgi:hypothetical protein
LERVFTSVYEIEIGIEKKVLKGIRGINIRG